MTEPSEFVFVDELPPAPPPTSGWRGVASVFVRFREALDANPGQWALYPGKPSANMNAVQQAAYTVNSGRRKTFPSDKYEATAREGKLYVRRYGV